jgi:hypothetical protein
MISKLRVAAGVAEYVIRDTCAYYLLFFIWFNNDEMQSSEWCVCVCANFLLTMTKNNECTYDRRTRPEETIHFFVLLLRTTIIIIMIIIIIMKIWEFLQLKLNWKIKSDVITE